jgi:hypothetical protein
MRAKQLRTCVLAGLGAALSMPVAAQEHDETGPNAAQVTVYGWLTGYGGEIQPGPGTPRFAVSKSFGELFEDLDAAFFASGFVRRDRVVFAVDLSHSSSSKEGLIPTGQPAPFPPAVPAQGRLRQTSLTALAGYRVADGDGATLDVMGGLRAWWVRPRLTVPALALSREPDVDFVDPIIAARANFRVNPRVSILAYTDVGGFGAGSDLTFQALATVNARVARRVWLSGGYRYLLVDYAKNGVRVDSRLGGPLVGATFTF